jgi:hypothetical protein
VRLVRAHGAEPSLGKSHDATPRIDLATWLKQREPGAIGQLAAAAAKP